MQANNFQVRTRAYTRFFFFYLVDDIGKVEQRVPSGGLFGSAGCGGCLCSPLWFLYRYSSFRWKPAWANPAEAEQADFLRGWVGAAKKLPPVIPRTRAGDPGLTNHPFLLTC